MATYLLQSNLPSCSLLNRDLINSDATFLNYGVTKNDRIIRRAGFFGLALKHTTGVSKCQLGQVDCVRCPQHDNYFNLETLTVKNLPADYQTDHLLVLIKSLFELTLMIEVPSDLFIEEKQIIQQGTGKVEKVVRFDKSICLCLRCKSSKAPAESWAQITVSSSSVLISDFDAQKYLCTFFLNKNEFSDVKCITANELLSFDTMLNTSSFVINTCDSDLIKKLEKSIHLFNEAYNKCTAVMPNKEEKLIIVVSHPHSCIKHVSFSTCIRDEHVYNEPVCPGCSGAKVISLSANQLEPAERGVLEENPVSSFKTLEEQDICVRTKSGPDDQELMSISCHDQSSHGSFIDISSDFTPHLPVCYRHTEMTELIKSLGHLTVMIDAKSPDSSLVYQGTGRIDKVSLWTNQNVFCQCIMCQQSDSPSKQWAEIRITTSYDLIKKTNDVKNVISTLFYDSVCKDKLEFLYGNKIEVSNEKSGMCKFISVSCNMQLVSEIQNLLRNFSENRKKAYSKYLYIKSNKERLLILISHPHSCRKYLSIGKWNKDVVHKRLLHDATTCPGSSGAYLFLPTFDMGQITFSFMRQHNL